MIRSLLEAIIKISEKDETHYKVILFGFIKFSLLKNTYKKRAKEIEDNFNYYKNNNIDITTMPKATGIMRDLQLAQLELLKEFDYVCRKSGLDYWIDFGTLLGAVRHKGFIPWDDDIDVGMPREDYNKIIDAFNSLTRNKKMKADYIRKGNSFTNYFIRIMYEDAPLLLDIFPYDFWGENLTFEQQQEKTNYIKAQREEKINKIVHSKGMTNQEIKVAIQDFRKEILVNGEYLKESKTDLVWGVDFYHLWKHWFYSYETIYPLQEIEFEGINFKCINQIDKYLKTVYGNYMAYPKDAKHSHSIYRFTETQLKEIKKSLIKEENK